MKKQILQLLVLCAAILTISDTVASQSSRSGGAAGIQGKNNAEIFSAGENFELTKDEWEVINTDCACFLMQQQCQDINSNNTVDLPQLESDEALAAALVFEERQIAESFDQEFIRNLSLDDNNATATITSNSNSSSTTSNSNSSSTGIDQSKHAQLDTDAVIAAALARAYARQDAQAQTNNNNSSSTTTNETSSDRRERSTNNNSNNSSSSTPAVAVKEKEDEEGKACQICLDDFTSTDMSAPCCLKKYHIECWNKWLKADKRGHVLRQKGRCPNCRTGSDLVR